MSKFFSDKYKDLKPYVPGEQPKEQKFIKLNTNESPFPPSPFAQKFAREAVGDFQLYSDPECTQLINVASEKFGVKREQILFSNGSDEMLNFAMMAYCDSTHKAVFPDVTYGFYPVMSKLNGVEFEEIKLNDDFTVNVDDYLGINKTIFIANPNAPTGIALPVSDIEKILKSNSENIVVVDEAYVDFGAESCVPLINKYDNLLVIQTFSKSRSLAGARLGVAFANEKIISDLNTIKYSTNPYNVNRSTMAAGVGALVDEDYFISNCNKIIENRIFTVKELKRLGFVVIDSKANFVFAKNNCIDGETLYLKLRENGILVRHFNTEKLKDYNRITIGSMEDMKIFISTLEKIL